MNTNTTAPDTRKARSPFLITSTPINGLTENSLMGSEFNGTSNAPAFNTPTNSLISVRSKSPRMMPLPLITSSMLGAE